LGHAVTGRYESAPASIPEIFCNILLRFPCLTAFAAAIYAGNAVQCPFNCMIRRPARTPFTPHAAPVAAFIRPALPLRRVGAVFASNRTTTKET